MVIRILVVDDASFIRDMVKKHLRERVPGVEVFEAVDGHRALAALKKQSMDLILSDWEMPNMSGEELLRAVRANPDTQAIPFVMVTSRGDRNYVIKAVEAGASDYLTKPFTPDELLRKVAKQLAKVGKAPAVEAVSRGSNQGSTQGSTQGIASASVGVLMGGRSEPAPSPAPAAKAAKKLKGKAQLRFSNRGESLTCVVRELSLQTLAGLIQRTDELPSVFDQVVVDIETDSDTEAGVERLNGYLHAIQAAENNPETQVVKVVVRFVDQDAQKFEALSRYIARM